MCIRDSSGTGLLGAVAVTEEALAADPAAVAKLAAGAREAGVLGSAHHLAGSDLRRALRLLGGALEQQLVVDLEDHARRLADAVPWMTVFTARRSPSFLVCQLRARSSGIWRRRPNRVDT